MLQAAITRHSGVSAFFAGGVTAYSLHQKVKLLGVDARHARRVNCVSARVAKEMAAGVADLFQTDIGIATTGYAEPSAEHGVASSLAYWAIFFKDTDRWLSGKFEGSGLSRVQVQKGVTSTVLKALREGLINSH